MQWIGHAILLRISSVKLSEMSAIPEAWYKQNGDGDQKQNDDNGTDDPDPRCYKKRDRT